jgi:hypothetical protein
MLTLGGCGKAPEPAAPTVPAATATPEATSTPTSGKPSAVVQPPAKTDTKTVYVIEGFQAVSADGTHEIPTGAAVTVISEEGDEYVISHQGLSVRTPKAYFSETIVEAPAPSPSPIADASPTPDTIPLTTEPAATPTALEPVANATPNPIATPGPDATPDPALAADEAKSQELMGQIRSINDEIRSATDKMEVAPSNEKAREAAKIEKLKKRRDSLSEDLTKVAKP